MTTDTLRDEVIDGKYQLLREVASGAQGVVYEARALLTGQIVALKRLRPEYSSSPRVARRFIQESTIASRFSHPNIVQVLDAGQDPVDGTLYMVQPLLEGADLRDVLAGRGPLSPREALDLMLPVMAALIAVHRAGVVHRDVKPENILLAHDVERGVRPVLIDFGIVKLLDADPALRTATGAVIGTPLYMAPEQATGDPTVDARADVWAVAVILCEMITGSAPFRANSVPEILARIVGAPAPRLDAVVPTVSRELADIVERALAIPREQRFPTMAAFIEALLECPRLDAQTTGRDLAARHHAALTAKVPLDAQTTTRFAPVFEVAAPIAPASPSQRTPTPGSERVDAGSRPVRTAGRSRASSAAILIVGALLGASLTAALVRPRAGSFTVSVAAEPASATMEIDGVPAGAGRFERSFPRDGRVHVLRITAPGHIAREVTFRDEAPPTRQRLAVDTPPQR